MAEVRPENLTEDNHDHSTDSRTIEGPSASEHDDEDHHNGDVH